jgi:hypothetical protein
MGYVAKESSDWKNCTIEFASLVQGRFNSPSGENKMDGSNTLFYAMFSYRSIEASVTCSLLLQAMVLLPAMLSPHLSTSLRISEGHVRVPLIQ